MKNLFLMVLAVAALTSCEKQIKSLPDATETGANTFGAKIDGSLWGPMKFGPAHTAPILEARFADNNSIYINARNFASSPTETEMEIYLKNISKPGIIYLNQNTDVYPNESASYAFFVKRKIRPENEWVTSNQLGGWVSISRFDPVNRIISGTFEFEAADGYGSANPIKVSEGRFDVTIQ